MSGVVLAASLVISVNALPAQAAELTTAQINSILSLLEVFGADQSVIGNVRASLTGTPSSTTGSATTGGGGSGGGSTTPPQPSGPPIPVIQPQNIPSFDRDLYLGLRNDSDVSDLQEFLTEQGYYAGPVSGNYGLLTVQAVRKFQSANGINPSGYFGVRSRALANQIIQKLVGEICGEEGCEGDVLPSQQLQIISEGEKLERGGVVTEYLALTFRVVGGSGNYAITSDGRTPPGLAWTRTYCPPSSSVEMVELACAQFESPDSITLFGTPRKSGVFGFVIFAKGDGVNGMYGKARFTIVIKDKVSSDRPPVISGVKGPTTLSVGEEGIWTINASDASNGPLSYSVRWGDEQGVMTQGMAPSSPESPFIQTAAFSHTYRSAGVYTPVFSVVNDSGQSAKTSLSVRVGMTNPPVPATLSLSYLQAKAEDQNVLRPGEWHVLYGSGLTNYLKLWINGQGVSVSKVYADGSGLEFIAPANLSSGTTAYVNVTDASGRGSNKIAVRVATSATTPSITITSPNGGEAWQVGSTQSVQWSSTGIATNPGSISAELYKGDISARPLFYAVANNGSQGFTVPSNTVPGNDYKIHIYCTPISGVQMCSDDYSDSPFSIAAATSTQPSITVLSPNGGSTVTTGTYTTISWSATGSGFDKYQIVVGNSITNSERQLYDRVSTVDYIPVSQTSFPWLAPDLLADFARGSSYSFDQIKGSFYLQIKAIKNDSVGGSYVASSGKVPFSIAMTTTSGTTTASSY